MKFKNKNVLLNETELNAFYLVASNKEEIQEITKAVNNKDINYPFIDQIEIFGKSIEATKGLANIYIPIEHQVHKKEALENGSRNYKYWVEKEYKCYCREKKIIENNLLLHEDSLSSLKCAIYRIGSPEYCYIIKIKK